MANIFDYLKRCRTRFLLRPSFEWVRHSSLNRNHLPILWQSGLYSSSATFRPGTSGSKGAKHVDQQKPPPAIGWAISTQALQKLQTLPFYQRHRPWTAKQFAAMTYRLTLDTYLIVFRGTDDSIIGWKEDFHLTYMKEIPCSKARPPLFKRTFFAPTS